MSQPENPTSTVWARLRAPLPREAIKWRVDSDPKEKDGRWSARAVAYADVPAVLERFESVVPGEFDITADAAQLVAGGKDYYVKCRLQILGVLREDVGMGPDPKEAHTDAIKRAARLFGVGIELWGMGPVYVEVDGGGKYAQIVGDPWAAHDRKRQAAQRNARDLAAVQAERQVSRPAADERPQPARTAPAVASAPRAASSALGTEEEGDEDPACPVCAGPMFDNRLTKRNPKAPDHKCKDRGCSGVIWPPKGSADHRSEGTPLGL